MHIFAYIVTSEYNLTMLIYFLIKFSIAMQIETQDNAIWS